MDNSIITPADLRAAGYCVKGAREWCDKNGVDFRAFMRNGLIEVSELPQDSAIIQHILKVKAERQ